MLAWFALALAVVLGVYIMSGGEAFAALDGSEIAYIVVAVTLVTIYVASAHYHYRGRALTGLRHVTVYLGLFLALIAAYTYRDVLMQSAVRITGELTPPGYATDVETNAAGEHSVRLRRRTNGHFAARGEVNGTALTMLVDTGASTVVLKPADAEKAGIDISNLTYTVAVDTANGSTYAAPVRLKAISIGPIEVRDVEALVAKPGTLKESLLGISFLKRLRSYEFSGEYLTLRG